jgi:hypothetical protein
MGKASVLASEGMDGQINKALTWRSEKLRGDLRGSTKVLT